MQHDTNCFAQELSELCRKHGLGLTNATVFVMEPEDYLLQYAVDDESCLTFDPVESVKSGQNSDPAASQEQYQHRRSL